MLGKIKGLKAKTVSMFSQHEYTRATVEDLVDYTCRIIILYVPL